MNTFRQILMSLAKTNPSTLIKVGIPSITLGCVGIYVIKTLADHDAIVNGYERETKLGNFETKLKRADSDNVRVCIEPDKYQP